VAYRVLRIAPRSTLHAPRFTLHASRFTALLAFLPALLLLGPALTAARAGYPVGGNAGAYEGIDRLAAELRALPPGSVLYDHWLGWELSFYLFDGPATISWFPTPEALAADLRAFGRSSPRYLAVPAWEGEADLRAAAASAGFAFRAIFRTFRRDGSVSFTLYRLVLLSGAATRAATRGQPQGLPLPQCVVVRGK
jgi:hypothetical protein